MRSSPSEVTFRPLATGDLPTLAEWLARPHVAEWWDRRRTLAEIEADYGPIIAGAVPVRAFLALRDGEEIGFIQAYTPAELHDHGWWLEEHDTGVRGIDQYLAHPGQLNQGLGTAMVRAFLAQLFADPGVTRVQTDPSPDNPRAIRCYGKAGFRAIREIDTPDGRALLMYCDR